MDWTFFSNNTGELEGLAFTWPRTVPGVAPAAGPSIEMNNTMRLNRGNCPHSAKAVFFPTTLMGGSGGYKHFLEGQPSFLP